MAKGRFARIKPARKPLRIQSVTIDTEKQLYWQRDYDCYLCQECTVELKRLGLFQAIGRGPSRSVHVALITYIITAHFMSMRTDLTRHYAHVDLSQWHAGLCQKNMNYRVAAQNGTGSYIVTARSRRSYCHRTLAWTHIFTIRSSLGLPYITSIFFKLKADHDRWWRELFRVSRDESLREPFI